MISLQILDIKHFMAHLLVQDTFHPFLLSEATITTYNTFQIDGHLHKQFFTLEEQEEKELEARTISTWEEVKPVCFDLIKGKKTPLSFKFIFLLAPNKVEKMLSQINPLLNPNDVNGLFLNIKYDGTSVYCITGVSIKTFSLDKTLDIEWDNRVKNFFKSHDISYEEQ